MKKILHSAAFFALAALVSACSGGGGGGSNGGTPTTTESAAEFQVDTGGILYGMFWNGHNLMAGSLSSYPKGGYYIIGSCPKNGTSLDDIDNVNSQTFTYGGSLGIGESRTLADVLRSPTTFCRGAAYMVNIKRTSDTTVDSEINIGPLPVEYAALSLPMDLTRSIFDVYRWPGGSGKYGDFGVVKNVGRQAWVEACSSVLKICVRRTILSGSYREALFYYNNGIINTELGFGIFLKQNSSFRLTERIEIRSFN